MAQEITRANVVPRQGGGANEGGVSSVRPQELQVHLYTSIKYSLHSDFVVVPTNLFGLRAIQNLCRTRKSEGREYIYMELTQHIPWFNYQYYNIDRIQACSLLGYRYIYLD
jgi:hypothetical protein